MHDSPVALTLVASGSPGSLRLCCTALSTTIQHQAQHFHLLGSRSPLLSVRSRLLAVSVLLAETMASIQFNFDMQMPIADRVCAIAPIINSMMESFDSADATVGVEAFQDDLQNRIRAAVPMEKKWLNIDTVGVHPDNREGAMVVPIDMHDLLKRRAKDC